MNILQHKTIVGPINALRALQRQLEHNGASSGPFGSRTFVTDHDDAGPRVYWKCLESLYVSP